VPPFSSIQLDLSSNVFRHKNKTCHKTDSWTTLRASLIIRANHGGRGITWCLLLIWSYIYITLFQMTMINIKHLGDGDDDGNPQSPDVKGSVLSRPIVQEVRQRALVTERPFPPTPTVTSLPRWVFDLSSLIMSLRLYDSLRLAHSSIFKLKIAMYMHRWVATRL
jgi:hypothetical protein